MEDRRPIRYHFIKSCRTMSDQPSTNDISTSSTAIVNVSETTQMIVIQMDVSDAGDAVKDALGSVAPMQRAEDMYTERGRNSPARCSQGCRKRCRQFCHV